MQRDDQDRDASPPAAILSEKEPWVAPTVIRIRAGDAEAGGNPVTREGAFANGS